MINNVSADNSDPNQDYFPGIKRCLISRALEVSRADSRSPT
jgi:hypothetical protein